ncbi:hypothetical protein [Mesorhizobium sp. A623]
MASSRAGSVAALRSHRPHEHWDHVSGFLTAAELFGDFSIGEVWMAWTENPTDPDAVALDRFKTQALSALQGVSRRLDATHGLSTYMSPIFVMGCKQSLAFSSEPRARTYARRAMLPPSFRPNNHQPISGPTHCRFRSPDCRTYASTCSVHHATRLLCAKRREPKRGLDLMESADLSAFIPTNQKDALKVRWGEIPYHAILTALAGKTQGRVVRADDEWIGRKDGKPGFVWPSGSILAVRNAARDPTRGEGGLWVELDLA